MGVAQFSRQWRQANKQAFSTFAREHPGMTTTQKWVQFSAEQVQAYTFRRTTASSAASGSEWYGADRPKWIGPFSEDSTPAYITGEYPGDYGWDTAGISSDPEQYEAYREIEVIHSRWAMIGSIGCITPEIIANYGGCRGIQGGGRFYWRSKRQDLSWREVRQHWL